MNLSFLLGVLISLSLVAREVVAAGADGALVQVKLQSTVGVIIDDIPEFAKEKVIQDYLKKDEKFWKTRALMQVEATLYRLVYRNAFYKNKGRLPLPPKELWRVQVSTPKEI